MFSRVCLCGYTINKHCTSANTYVSAVVVNKNTRVQTQTANHKRTARMNTNHMVLISFLSCLCALLGSHYLTNQTRTNHKLSNMPTSSKEPEHEAGEKESIMNKSIDALSEEELVCLLNKRRAKDASERRNSTYLQRNKISEAGKFDALLGKKRKKGD